MVPAFDVTLVSDLVLVACYDCWCRMLKKWTMTIGDGDEDDPRGLMTMMLPRVDDPAGV